MGLPSAAAGGVLLDVLFASAEATLRRQPVTRTKANIIDKYEL
jgi:hypothetical protein